jgi:hypothetical protein
MALGTYTLIYRVGAYPDQIIHQDFVDITIVQ